MRRFPANDRHELGTIRGSRGSHARMRTCTKGGWVTQPEHHAALWDKTLGVERRPLDVYEEAAAWN